MKRGITAVDLFCGAGGLTRGLLDAGIRVKKGFDIEENLRKTYEENNNGVNFFSTDVCDLKGKEILDGLDKNKDFFLLAGCAPCQPFSSINQKLSKKDKRRVLLLHFARLVKETKPDFILMENVPGLKSKGIKILGMFLETLRGLGYHYDFEVLDAKDYGVPQKRKRFVLVASKFYSVEIPVLNNILIKTVKDAIGKYPPIRAGKTHPEVPNHQARNLREINLRRLKATKKNGGSRSDLPNDLILECHKKHEGHSDVYGRMNFKHPSPTLTCKCTSISNGRFGHPSQNRAISVREAAAIQTFKDDYVFYGNMVENTRWIGNAVPVAFAKSLGEYFISLANSPN